MLLFYLWFSWSPIDCFLRGFHICSLQLVARLPFCLPFYMCFLLLLFAYPTISSLLQLSVSPTFHPISPAVTPPSSISSGLSPPPLNYPLVFFPTSRIYSFAPILFLSPAINISISQNRPWYFFLSSPTSLLLPLPEVLVYNFLALSVNQKADFNRKPDLSVLFGTQESYLKRLIINNNKVWYLNPVMCSCLCSFLKPQNSKAHGTPAHYLLAAQLTFSTLFEVLPLLRKWILNSFTHTQRSRRVR